MRSKYLKDFKTVEMSATLTLKNGVTVQMNHFPYSLEYDQRYQQYRPKDEGEWLIHGHLHSKYIKKGKQIDVGFDGKLDLFSEDEIIAIMEDSRDFIPSRVTEFYEQRKSDSREI
jgi:calcineurin-like phosphoesterase family protein